MYDVSLVGFGDNVVDIYEHTHTSYPGGNSVNVAVHAKRLGAYRCAYLGYFGSDWAAEQIICALKETGVELNRCRQIEGESGWSKVTLVNGDRTWLASNKGGVRGRTPWIADRFDVEYLSEFDVVHAGNYGFMETELPKLKRAGIPVAFDFSDDADSEYIRAVPPYVEYAFLSRSGRTKPQILEELQKICGYGPSICVATMGGEGVAAHYSGKFFWQPACQIGEVVDTMGAGDSLIAAFLLEAISRIKRRVLTGQDIQDSLLSGTQYAAVVCGIPGAFGFGQPCL